MSGRTDRVRAKELEDKYIGILYSTKVLDELTEELIEKCTDTIKRWERIACPEDIQNSAPMIKAIQNELKLVKETLSKNKERIGSMEAEWDSLLVESLDTNDVSMYS